MSDRTPFSPVLGVAVTLALSVACGNTPATRPRATVETTGRCRPERHVLSTVTLSGSPDFTFSDAYQQILDSNTDAGVVRGRVVSRGHSVFVADEASSREEDDARRRAAGLPPGARTGFGYTDYALEIVAYRGHEPTTYEPGRTVTLRVPGAACVDGAEYSAPGAPDVGDGDELYVLVRDQGVQGGGNSPDRLVATIKGADVYEIRGGQAHSQSGAAASDAPF